MKWLAWIALGVSGFAQVAQVQPSGMHRLEMLVGEWRVLGQGGRVEFHYDMERGMVGRARAEGTAQWRRMMVIHPENEDVVMDFYPVGGRAVRYRLETANRQMLRFVEISSSGLPRRKITYEKHGPGQLDYRFEVGDRVTDSGTLAMVVEVRPLSE